VGAIGTCIAPPPHGPESLPYQGEKGQGGRVRRLRPCIPHSLYSHLNTSTKRRRCPSLLHGQQAETEAGCLRCLGKCCNFYSTRCYRNHFSTIRRRRAAAAAAGQELAAAGPSDAQIPAVRAPLRSLVQVAAFGGVQLGGQPSAADAAWV
jgi:hypothetical protein